MFFISEVYTMAPKKYSTPLQESTYLALQQLNIPFQRVDTDEAITMDDCTLINNKLNMKMVKTLFLCNRQQTSFYLFITKGDKPFRSKDFSSALNIARVSFAPEELMKEMVGTKIGAATVFSALLDKNNNVQIVFDKDVMSEEWYGCSDGTTTGYMKVKTEQIINDFLPYTNHKVSIIEV
ncbi:YbaK/EbsC family protein (plasmid) [Priestia megaterium]|uniref:prolyl-tRNA synthetase associated domain-containing protein n=2 Tax=Priestia megaterium TaxID=1404 RepID=UPI001BED1E57|nr:prolyl-tRNA synthetase associated domain-containing protein [Priestia megaterium]